MAKNKERREVDPAESREVAEVPRSLLETPAENEAAALFGQETKGLARSVPSGIPIITINHQTGEFVLPSGEVVDRISGYPIFYFQTRRFYARAPKTGEKGTPPDCWSADMIKPSAESSDRQAETCAGCPQNEWGSANDGRGKKCATQTWVFLVNNAFGPPPVAVVIFPPSSIRALMGNRMSPGYFGRAQAKHKYYEIVWTTFLLEVTGDQVVHSIVHPIMGEPIKDMDSARALSKLKRDFVAMMESMRGKTGEGDQSVAPEEEGR